MNLMTNEEAQGLPYTSHRYGSYTLSEKYKTNQEKFSCSDGYWSDWTITEIGLPSTSRMPASGSKT